MTSVYISNEHIQAVSAVKSAKKLKVKLIAKRELPEGCILNGIITDETVLRAELSAMWKAFKLPKSGLRLVVESSAVSTKILTLPNLSKPMYMKKLIAENLLSGESEDTVYDYKTLGAARDGGITVLACMTEGSFVKSYVELFSGAGLKLASIDLAAAGLIRMAKFCGELSERTFVISVIDRNSVSNFLFIKGEYRFSNRTRLMSNRDTPELLDEIARMISSLVQFNKSEKSGEDITNVYFCGFSDKEINSASLNFDNIEFGTLPEMKSVAFQNAKSSVWTSDCVFNLGALL